MSLVEQQHRLALVTGGTSGIGKELSYLLAERGIDVVFTARNEDKAKETLLELERRKLESSWSESFGKFDYMSLDLASFKSIDDFMKRFNSKYQKLHILVNNAGTINATYKETEDGIEDTFQSNFLGHYMLTEGLLPKLLSTAKEIKESGTNGESVRIVQVAAMGHKFYQEDIKAEKFIDNQKSFYPLKEYCKTKLYQLFHAKSLAEKIDPSLPLYVNSCHPGIVKTNIASSSGILARFFMKIFSVDTKTGCTAPLYLALSPSIVEQNHRGMYFIREKAISSSLRGDTGGAKLDKCSPLVNDKELRDKLLNLSTKLIREKIYSSDFERGLKSLN